MDLSLVTINLPPTNYWDFVLGIFFTGIFGFSGYLFYRCRDIGGTLVLGRITPYFGVYKGKKKKIELDKSNPLNLNYAYVPPARCRMFGTALFMVALWMLVASNISINIK